MPLSLPAHIEVEDVGVRRYDVPNEVKITLFDTSVGGDSRLPLFEFIVDRGQLAEALNDVSGTGSGSGRSRKYSLLGKMQSS